MSDDEGVEGMSSQTAEPGITFKDVERAGANTGPKGVLADYAHAKEKMERLQEETVAKAWKDYNECVLALLLIFLLDTDEILKEHFASGYATATG